MEETFETGRSMDIGGPMEIERSMPFSREAEMSVLGAMFLQAFYGAVDLFVVGRFAETADVSGVATGSMFLHTVTCIVTGMTMGITVFVGQSIGEKNREKTNKGIGSGIFLFIIIAIIMTLAITSG